MGNSVLGYSERHYINGSSGTIIRNTLKPSPSSMTSIRARQRGQVMYR
jgi:hypothetical protein